MRPFISMKVFKDTLKATVMGVCIYLLTLLNSIQLCNLDLFEKANSKVNSYWMRRHQQLELQMLETEHCIVAYKEFVDILHQNLKTVSTA
ncbi:hypothetical protein RO3G_03464 [Rhizopus delemar RA 99-880]|uniref:Uncharacterized protein n=1 Tax=Rhizopus delemar (strain RA 99-880 / ATCC MYA-4621 / FGSC 9543 / NRRL 43880) TaxID=246409 RepID=I1BRC9_RHIO9|nr:hypothetical protein RO3G_03464 [Rhizopus delemar RA 99-880]|eukprot:EIE78759.1 hypothetical protein RO3G_03464 [Rhizopus delemar RA 99-880]